MIRHGETTANRDAVIAGRTDVELTDTGRAQARALVGGEWPSSRMLFTSPMQRARETSELGFPSEQPQVHPGLRERDWGVFEGQPLSALPPREGRPEQGEDWKEMIDRVSAAIHDCCACAQGRLPIMICHSGVIRAARILAGDTHTSTRPENAHPIYFDWTGTRHQERSHDV
ncbi:histidine phosphatase family protein [Aliiroseovarius halocynthiae]|uniref:Histidine phosphatase family protein n=1 Tax=Aliiroseovarius halocynthiae TaxID=985055 RepID=A0A545SSK9_9RHOB|nr:histidine phosphatase family protein [Aliiroseovarius halocynthiae]